MKPMFEKTEETFFSPTTKTKVYGTVEVVHPKVKIYFNGSAKKWMVFINDSFFCRSKTFSEAVEECKNIGVISVEEFENITAGYR